MRHGTARLRDLRGRRLECHDSQVRNRSSLKANFHKYAFSVRGRRLTPAVFGPQVYSWAVCVRPKGRVTKPDQWATATGLSLDGLYCYF